MIAELQNKLRIKYYLYNNKQIEESDIDLPINKFYKRLYNDRYNIYDIIPQNKQKEEIAYLDSLSHALEGVSDISIE